MHVLKLTVFEDVICLCSLDLILCKSKQFFRENTVFNIPFRYMIQIEPLIAPILDVLLGGVKDFGFDYGYKRFASSSI